ncbi:MAG: peptidoglycan editing factor PgeF [Alphaproteobacteria bacterium]|nr:MAG: peptidoglycan editing factor PgeF [Alphaproteobacteria bacterium]
MTERLTAAILAQPGVVHGFFTRRGGVSKGIYASLNVGRGSGDHAAHVAENRERARRSLGAERLVTPYQVHGAHVHVLDEAEDAASNPPRADALVTTRRGVAIGVVTADCVPVLLVDAAAGVIAAVHAGWRGAIAGIATAAVTAMQRLGADTSRIRAAIGPAIAQASYEVGAEVRDAFLAARPGADRFFIGGRTERFQLDLPGFVAEELAAAGLSMIEDLDCDTCADRERFFSYRRSSRLGEPDYGRQLSAILRL